MPNGFLATQPGRLAQRAQTGRRTDEHEVEARDSPDRAPRPGLDPSRLNGGCPRCEGRLVSCDASPVKFDTVGVSDPHADALPQS